MRHHRYGTKSTAKLNTMHPVLRLVAERALQLSPYDVTIIHGHRGEELQNALFDSGASHKQWPDSMHNTVNRDTLQPESEAVDFGPYVEGRVPWGDTHVFAVIAGAFFAAATEQGVTLRWGGDWDGDGSTTDQTLMDWGHIELA
jgi:peptidoglycan L-alanyl-D-glutamate endopeptidase CwlK